MRLISHARTYNIKNSLHINNVMPEITIFCDDAEAVTAYQSIVDFAIRETSFDSFEFLRIYADMKLPVFSCYLKIGSPGRSVSLGEVASITSHDGKTEITMNSEQYVPRLLEYVWKTFGRDAVEQPDRMKVIIQGNTGNLSSLMVDDPASRLKNRAYNFLTRIIPEAFKVQRMQKLDDAIFIVTSEDTIKDEWVQKSKEVLL